MLVSKDVVRTARVLRQKKKTKMVILRKNAPRNHDKIVVRN